jgi:hypothetical protein
LLHCSSLCFDIPLHALLFLCVPPFLLLRYSSFCFIVPLYVSLFLLLHYSSAYFATLLCFSIPPISLLLFLLRCSFVFYRSSCFIWLLFIVLGYCFMLHFVVVSCFASQLLMLHCCSCFGATMCYSVLHYSCCFVTLMPSQVPFYPLLFYCSSVLRYCLTFYYPLPFLFVGCWKLEFIIDWEDAWKHASSKLLISFFCFFFPEFFSGFPSLIWF